MDTTFRHHSLFILADNAVNEAHQAAKQAFWKWQRTGRMEDQTRWLQLDKIWHDAEAYRNQVKGMKKFMHDTVQA